MRAGFEHMQAEDGGSVYLRLSTRPLVQLDRDLQTDTALADGIIKGGYWHTPPNSATKRVVAFAGVLAPEAIRAAEARARTSNPHGPSWSLPRS